MILLAYLSSKVKYNLIAGVYIIKLRHIPIIIEVDPVISAAQGNIDEGTKNAEYSIISNALILSFSTLGSNHNPAVL